MKACVQGFGATLLAVAVLTAAPAAAATFTVNSTGDASDANPGNGTCAASGGDVHGQQHG